MRYDFRGLQKDTHDKYDFQSAGYIIWGIVLELYVGSSWYLTPPFGWKPRFPPIRAP